MSRLEKLEKDIANALRNIGKKNEIVADILNKFDKRLACNEYDILSAEKALEGADETAISLYEAQEAQEAINTQQDEALMEIYEMIG